MSGTMRQYASKSHSDYLEKLQDLRKEYTPVLSGRKARNTPKEAQAFLERRKEMQKGFKPRPVAPKQVKQVLVDLSKEMGPRDASPEPADDFSRKPTRFRITRTSVAIDDEPLLPMIPAGPVPVAKRPVPVLQTQTHNVMITPKPASTAAPLFIPELDPTALLFPTSLYRPQPFAIDQFRVFVGNPQPVSEVTPEKPPKRKGEVLEAVSFDEFMNQVVVTPRVAKKEKFAEFKPEELTPVNTTKSHTSTTPSKPSNLLHFKEAAGEKERRRQLRLKAAVKIQRLVRVFLAKCQLKRLREERTQSLLAKESQEVASRVKRQWAQRVVEKAILSFAERRRDEKAQLVVLFRNHCAILIQKHWRAFLCRQRYLEQVEKLHRRKEAFEAVICGWRTRKVIHLKPVQDIIKQVRELAEMVSGTSDHHFSPTEDLIESAKRTLPSLKGKLLVLLEKMQENGTWVRYKLRTGSVPQTPKTSEMRPVVQYEQPLEPLSSKRSYEDRPIRPLQQAYETLAEQGEEVRTESPRPRMRFSNFLRKSNRAVVKAPASESDHEEEKPIETLPVPASLEPEEPQSLDSKAIKPYLKRKSQTIKAKKLKWKVTKKIDCWIDRSQPEEVRPRAEKQEFAEEPRIDTPKKETPPVLGKTMTVDDLESVFEQLLSKHTDAHAYFKRAGRRDKSTFIPQFQQFSYFVTHFTEDIFRDTFLALEKHYKLLCREDWLDA